MTTKGLLLALSLIAATAFSACCCAGNNAAMTKNDRQYGPQIADAEIRACAAALQERKIDPATKTFHSTPGLPRTGITSEELARLKQKYPRNDLVTYTYAAKEPGVGGSGIFVVQQSSREIVWMALGR